MSEFNHRIRFERAIVNYVDTYLNQNSPYWSKITEINSYIKKSKEQLLILTTKCFDNSINTIFIDEERFHDPTKTHNLGWFIFYDSKDYEANNINLKTNFALKCGNKTIHDIKKLEKQLNVKIYDIIYDENDQTQGFVVIPNPDNIYQAVLARFQSVSPNEPKIISINKENINKLTSQYKTAIIYVNRQLTKKITNEPEMPYEEKFETVLKKYIDDSFNVGACCRDKAIMIQEYHKNHNKNNSIVIGGKYFDGRPFGFKINSENLGDFTPLIPFLKDNISLSNRNWNYTTEFAKNIGDQTLEDINLIEQLWNVKIYDIKYDEPGSQNGWAIIANPSNNKQAIAARFKTDNNVPFIDYIDIETIQHYTKLFESDIADYRHLLRTKKF